ncbi:MAG: HAD-IC family P-type ATPase, partial [Patescibacteria group bacterium]
ENIYKISGDPTEAAMLTFGEKIGFDKNDLEEEQPRILEIPFDYKTKYHLVINKNGKKDLMSVVGAPEVVLNFCKKIWHPEKTIALTKEKREELDKIFAVMSKKGYRAIAYAIKEKVKIGVNEVDSLPAQAGLIFVGFYFMRDIIREEVFEAMQKTREAGIKIVMITGDHRITAKSIAREVGIFQDGDKILTGDEIDKLSEKQLIHRLGKTIVFARVTPEHKLKIIEGYKKRGEIIAMTGDGVNDALSLVAADLGVSMGKIGTEVAKEASDIILLDDNFGSIVAAVEEGRSIYKTIKKVLLYLFSTSVGEVLVIAGAITIDLPLPILAVQILWLNLITDGFLDVSLAMEPKEGGLLKNYKQPGKYFIDKLMVKRMVLMGIPMMIGTLYLFNQYYETDLKKGWTIALTTMAVFQWFNAWNCRHENKSIFIMNPLKNKYLIAATFVVFALQLIAVYTPLMQKMLHTTPLTLSEWITITIIASSILIVEESRKLLSKIKTRIPQLATSKA